MAMVAKHAVTQPAQVNRQMLSSLTTLVAVHVVAFLAHRRTPQLSCSEACISFRASLKSVYLKALTCFKSLHRCNMLLGFMNEVVWEKGNSHMCHARCCTAHVCQDLQLPCHHSTDFAKHMGYKHADTGVTPDQAVCGHFREVFWRHLSWSNHRHGCDTRGGSVKMWSCIFTTAPVLSWRWSPSMQ